MTALMERPGAAPAIPRIADRTLRILLATDVPGWTEETLFEEHSNDRRVTLALPSASNRHYRLEVAR